MLNKIMENAVQDLMREYREISSAVAEIDARAKLILAAKEPLEGKLSEIKDKLYQITVNCDVKSIVVDGDKVTRVDPTTAYSIAKEVTKEQREELTEQGILTRTEKSGYARVTLSKKGA